MPSCAIAFDVRQECLRSSAAGCKALQKPLHRSLQTGWQIEQVSLGNCRYNERLIGMLPQPIAPVMQTPMIPGSAD